MPRPSQIGVASATCRSSRWKTKAPATRWGSLPPRRRYSWELEEELAAQAAATADADREQFEPASPADVPVLWQRPEPERGGAVLPFPPRRGDTP